MNKHAIYKRFQPVLVLYALGLVVNFFTRIVLLMLSFQNLDLTVINIAGIFFIGALYDLCALSFVSIPFVLLCWLNNDSMYTKPRVFILLGLMILLTGLSFVKNPIPEEFDKKLPVILSVLMLLLTGMYFLLWKKNVAFRIKWRNGFFYLLFFIVSFLFVFNIISELAFWQEFGVRYNFIAVDYLIYTHEVIGNIKESYPVGWIVLGVLMGAFFLFDKKIHCPLSIGTGIFCRENPRRDCIAGCSGMCIPVDQ